MGNAHALARTCAHILYLWSVLDAQSYIHTHKLLTTVKPQGITRRYSYTFTLTVYTTQSLL